MSIDDSPGEKSPGVQTAGVGEISQSENSNFSPDSDEAGIDFGNAIEFLPQGIFVIDTNYTIKCVNPSLVELSGVEAGAAIGKKCYEVFPSSLCHTPGCCMIRILNGERSTHAEIKSGNDCDSSIPCTVSAFPLYKDKKLIGIMESYQDIIVKRKLEDQASEAEDHYKAIVELAGEVGEGILMLQDIDGKEGSIIFASDQFYRLVGFTKEELLGKSAFELMEPEDGRASLLRHRRKMEGNSLPGLYEVSIIRKDGSQLPAELTSAVTQYRGKPTNVIYLRNISERKKVEAELVLSAKRYQELFENAPVCLWEMDNSELKKYIEELKSQGVKDFKKYLVKHPEKALYALKKQRITKMNKYAEAMMGGEAFKVNKRIDQIVNEVGGVHYGTDVVFIDFIHRLSLGQKHLSDVLPITTLSGSVKYILQKVSIMPGYEDTWGKVIIADIDITELKKKERELQEYQNHLENMVEKRTKALRAEIDRRMEFTKLLVHEMKTPLTPLLGASEALCNLPIAKEYQGLIRNVYSGSVRLNKRVDELMDLAKGEMGSLGITCNSADIKKILQEVSDDMKPEFDKKRQQFSLNINPDIPTVLIDKGRIEQVILNLLSNASKFTPEEGLISLTADVDNCNIIVEITDTGCGINKTNQKYLFKPYRRIKIDHDNYGGLGLGLALSKTLVELHKGKIWVKSKPGAGSTFGFSIPVTELI